VRIESISAGEGEKFTQVITEFKEDLEKLGPIKPDEYRKPLPTKKQIKVQEKARLNEI
jgi:hypothetical protein